MTAPTAARAMPNAHQDILYYGESVLEHINEVFYSGDSTTDYKANAGEHLQQGTDSGGRCTDALDGSRDRIHGTCNLRCHRHDRADCTHDLSNKDKDRPKSSHEKCHHEDDLLYWLWQFIEKVHQALQSRY